MTLLSDIYYIAQLRALEGSLLESDAYAYRKICRWYSKSFSTKLLDVYRLPVEHLLTNYYEDIVGSLPHNERVEALRGMLPELIKEDQKELDNYMKSLEEEQQMLMEKANKKSPSKTTPKIQSLSQANDNELQEDPIKTFEMEFEDD